MAQIHANAEADAHGEFMLFAILPVVAAVRQVGQGGSVAAAFTARGPHPAERGPLGGCWNTRNRSRGCMKKRYPVVHYIAIKQAIRYLKLPPTLSTQGAD